MEPSFKPEATRATMKEKKIQAHVDEQQYIQHRIEELEKMLATTQDPAQRTNIKAALEIYRQGKVPGGGRYQFSYFQDGKLKALKEVDFKLPKLREVCFRAVILLNNADFSTGIGYTAKSERYITSSIRVSLQNQSDQCSCLTRYTSLVR